MNAHEVDSTDNGHDTFAARSEGKSYAQAGVDIEAGAVSYTHLTLPTIYSV